MPLIHKPATELHELIKTKQVSSRDVTEAFLAQIHHVEPSLNAFLTLTDDLALSMADAVDQKVSKGLPLGPLEGVPIAIKDNICTENIPTTCASTILKGFLPPYNATLIETLKQAGLPILGKTNMDEFAMGSSTETSAYQKTHNPWNVDCVPGGSSGGSAVAVAGFEAPLSIGSDTGGSIRQPASFCGNVGLKPTYGRVSRYGLIAFASSLDQIGSFANNVTDTAHLLNLLAGHDPKDSTSLALEKEDFTRLLGSPKKGLRVGLPNEFFKHLSPEVKALYTTLINTLSQDGIEFVWLDLPSIEYALATYYIIAPAEASSNLARYDGVRFGFRAAGTSSTAEMIEQSRSQGFGAEVKRRILIGTYVLSSGYYDAYYKKAQKVRTLIKKDFDRAFEQVDIIASPTTPTPAFKLGEKTNDPLEMYLSDIMTIPLNLAGLPGLSIPCGLHNNLPMGWQLMGKAFDEARLLQVAHQMESLIGFGGCA